MTKSESLISLVNSMTQHEKRAFKMASQNRNKKSGYLILFDLISGQKDISATYLRDQFSELTEENSFDSTAKYLYQILLNTLLDLRKEQDSYYYLFNEILKARILFEKSLYDDSFNLLTKTIEKAQERENYYALLLASKLELEYLLALNFPLVNEKEILSKQFKINEIINIIKKTNVQSSIYELLKYRLVHQGNVRTQEQKQKLNDLVVSEMSIVSSSNIANFEINKFHQLFQANYLISVGDYESALRSFIELNSLFENNRHLWNNPPMYYLLTIEGVLDSLRSIKNYDGMSYFINQLKILHSPSVNYNANVKCLVFLYEQFPQIDRGFFQLSESKMNELNDLVENKLHLLSRVRQAEICLYAAIISFGNHELTKASKFLNMIVFKVKDYHSLPLYRTFRLIKLMIAYDTGNFSLISHETLSIKRELKMLGQGFLIEKMMLTFLNNQTPPTSKFDRLKLWAKVSEKLAHIEKDANERQALRIFDFTAWMESKILKIPLVTILQRKQQNPL